MRARTWSPVSLLLFCSLATPAFLSATPIVCPTTNYADLLTLSSCTVSIYTLSDFTFSSTALNGESTPYTASEFTVAPHDAVYDPNSYLYFGLNLTGGPGAPAGESVTTDISFNVVTTDGSNQIRAVALGSDFTANPGGSVTLADTGTYGAGSPFSIQVSDTVPLAQQRFASTNSVQNNAVLTTVGPDKVRSFTIDISDLSGLGAPEPTTFLLFGIGLLGIAYGGKKIRKRV